MESILMSVRKMVGPHEDCADFDTDLIVYTNAALNVLAQLGVGPKNGFSITGTGEQWTDFLPDTDHRYELVKAFVMQKVRLLFDPPTSSAVLNAMTRAVDELEWRILVTVETV